MERKGRLVSDDDFFGNNLELNRPSFIFLFFSFTHLHWHLHLFPSHPHTPDFSTPDATTESKQTKSSEFNSTKPQFKYSVHTTQLTSDTVLYRTVTVRGRYKDGTYTVQYSYPPGQQIKTLRVQSLLTII